MSQATLKTINHFLPLTEYIGTAGQPTLEQLPLLREAGYEVVVNLRPFHETLPDEQALVEAQGLEYVSIPVIWATPQLTDLEQFCAVMEANQARKVFVHCAVNRRVSAFMYLYRVLHLDFAPAEAARDLHRIWTPMDQWAAFLKQVLPSVRPFLSAPNGHIEAVLFDLDNTLYNRDAAFHQWAEGFVQAHFPTEPPNAQAAIRDQFIAWDAGGYTPRPDLFGQILAHYPMLPYTPEALLERFYTEWVRVMTLDAETLTLLEELERAHIPLGIITNGTAPQHLKIDQLGLRPRLHVLTVSGDFGVHKPDPAIFQATAAQLGIPCDRILFVGDNPEADILGAKGVGMQAAWLPWGREWIFGSPSPDYRLASLGELIPLLSLHD